MYPYRKKSDRFIYQQRKKNINLLFVFYRYHTKTLDSFRNFREITCKNIFYHNIKVYQQ